MVFCQFQFRRTCCVEIKQAEMMRDQPRDFAVNTECYRFLDRHVSRDAMAGALFIAPVDRKECDIGCKIFEKMGERGEGHGVARMIKAGVASCNPVSKIMVALQNITFAILMCGGEHRYAHASYVHTIA